MTGATSTVQRMKERATDAIPSNVVDVTLRALNQIPVRTGTPVYERDWDVLCVLDACRYDMYCDVVGPCEPYSSVASTSTVWMDETFDTRYQDDVEDTAYISANPYSHRLDERRFGVVDHVWRDAWEEELGTIPADPVTDRGITAARDGEYGRVICHYMQPHFPAIPEDHRMGRLSPSGFDLDDDGTTARNPWRMLEQGELDQEDVIAAYFANLEYVMGHVETLLENVDGTVAITADHGNALGELGMWGHRAYVPSRALRRVPWDVRECTDKRTHEPDAKLGVDDRMSDQVIRERLQALGYTEE